MSRLNYLLTFTEDDEEGWAGHGMTEKDHLLKAQREAEERRRREGDKRRAKISQQSLDLEGRLPG